MTGTYRTSFDDDSNAPETEILGGTDQTKIGNVNDRLKVDASFSAGGVPVIGTNLRYDDMNASNGGVARETLIGGTYTTVYNYTGSGLLLGFLVTLEEEQKWQVRLTVDSNVVFELLTNDLNQADLYGYDFNDKELPFHLGFALVDKTLRWKSPNFPMKYNSSVELEVRKSDGGSKKIRAGLVCLTK